MSCASDAHRREGRGPRPVNSFHLPVKGSDQIGDEMYAKDAVGWAIHRLRSQSRNRTVLQLRREAPNPALVTPGLCRNTLSHNGASRIQG